MSMINRFWAIGKQIRRQGGLKATAKMAQSAPKYLALYKRLLADPRVPASAKAVLLGAAGFAVSPLNVPNYIPVIGAIDDIAIIILANGYFVKHVPAHVMAEHRSAVGLAADMAG